MEGLMRKLIFGVAGSAVILFLLSFSSPVGSCHKTYKAKCDKLAPTEGKTPESCYAYWKDTCAARHNTEKKKVRRF
jgi:hypothetical protein